VVLLSGFGLHIRIVTECWSWILSRLAASWSSSRQHQANKGYCYCYCYCHAASMACDPE